MAFRDFTRYVLTSGDNQVRCDGHWDLQTNILCEGLIFYDVIGRFERFTEDFATVLRRLDAPEHVLALAAEVTNATSQVPLAAVYDRELADFVYDRYQTDFDAFGYERDSWMFHDMTGPGTSGRIPGDCPMLGVGLIEDWGR